MCYYTILVLCQWKKKRHLLPKPTVLAGRKRAANQHTTLCPLKTTNSQSGGGALHINTLNLVRVKSGRSVSARGWSQHGCSGLAKQGAAACSLWHRPSLHMQASSAQLPAAGKQVTPFYRPGCCSLPDLPFAAAFNVSAMRATSAQRLAGVCTQVGSVCTLPVIVYHIRGWHYRSAIEGHSFFVSFSV